MSSNIISKTIGIEFLKILKSLAVISKKGFKDPQFLEMFTQT